MKTPKSSSDGQRSYQITGLERISGYCNIFYRLLGMLRVGRVTGRVGSGKFFTGRVGSGQQILKFPRVGSGHGSAKNFQRVGRVKEKCLTGQAGQGKKFHGSDGSKIFQKNCYFSCKFSKIPLKICFL